MSVSVQQATSCVFDAIEDFNQTEERKLEKSAETALLGAQSRLDSLGLVRFVIAVEQQVEDRFGVPVSLTDEKAMSQRNSPFRTVGTLIEYITSCLNAGNDV